MNDYGLTQALYQKLLGNRTLMEAVTGIYTHIPEDASPPYLHLQLLEITDASATPGRPSASLKFQLDFYSQYHGVVELQGVMGVLSRYLKGIPLPLMWQKNRGMACLRELSQQQSLQSDGLTRKGTLTYQCLIQF